MIEVVAWILELTSVLIVTVVALEYYVSDHQFNRGKISIEPSSTEPSQWRLKHQTAWATYKIEHAFEIDNSGNRTCRISNVHLDSIDAPTDTDGTTISRGDIEIQTSIRTSELPDGKRIPPTYEGLIYAIVEIREKSPTRLFESQGVDVTLDFEVIDNRGQDRLSVTDTVQPYPDNDGPDWLRALPIDP